ncbi:MAG: DUF2007 domain-containing protein [Acidobacteria bacterium]|nr:DUF2007 domain-containing protein [Acidobacteriota bacterium]
MATDEPDIEWVVVAAPTWLHEALFLKSVLESAAIEATIPDEYTLGVQPLYSNMIGGARVLVRATDRTRAEELLRSVDAQPGPAPEDDSTT